MSLFKERKHYKPFDYPWAYNAFSDSERMHWVAKEVQMNQDVRDWKVRLSPEERNLCTQLFRFFTQADVDIASAYIDRYLPMFKPPEIRMMLSSFAAREAVHIQAYSTLIDEIGMPETEYSAFLDYQAMRDKHEYLFRPRLSDCDGIAEDIAVFSAFGEGLQLFSSFIMLLNFTRFGKMKSMGQIIAWSIRDETHHVESMIKLFHQLLAENPSINMARLRSRIEQHAINMVGLEEQFISLAFEQGGAEDLTEAQVREYIYFIADTRLRSLGNKPLFGVSKNPLPWVNPIVFGREAANFFEARPTDYSKGGIEGSWDDAF